MRLRGRITVWNDDRGFGFITPEGNSVDIFVHISAFTSRRIRPDVGMEVTYLAGFGKDGRRRAEEVELLVTDLPGKQRTSTFSLSLVVAIGFLLAIGTLTILQRLSPIVASAYLLLSAVTFAIYGFDKMAAVQGRRRTPEVSLQFLSLLGGWPGAILAQQLLRHKTRKFWFQFDFWLAVTINASVLAWTFTAHGQRLVKDLVP